LLFAQEQADRRVIVWRFYIRINGGKVEVQLTGILWLEGRRFEFDNDVASQLKMIEQQINKKLRSTNLKPILATNKCKTGA
jgi:hypothetical protein